MDYKDTPPPKSILEQEVDALRILVKMERAHQRRKYSLHAWFWFLAGVTVTLIALSFTGWCG